jgi:hypothetical protein
VSERRVSGASATFDAHAVKATTNTTVTGTALTEFRSGAAEPGQRCRE